MATYMTRGEYWTIYKDKTRTHLEGGAWESVHDLLGPPGQGQDPDQVKLDRTGHPVDEAAGKL